MQINLRMHHISSSVHNHFPSFLAMAYVFIHTPLNNPGSTPVQYVDIEGKELDFEIKC